MTKAVARPVLRYHGGKFRLAPWIISHFPKHRVYVEPFMGAASVLLQKPRAYSEIINDLDGLIVGLFGVLRDPDLAAELSRRLALTPYARDEFEGSYEPPIDSEGDPVEMARRLMVRSWMGISSRGATSRHRTGYRAAVSRGGTHPAVDWSQLPEYVDSWTRRLRGVLIENRPALEVICRYDCADGVIYCDPPYLHSSRGDSRVNTGRAYRHEMSDQEHAELAKTLRACVGGVVVSGYESDLYQELYSDWHVSSVETLKDSAQRNDSVRATEVLWINESAWRRLNPPLFGGW